MSLRLYSYIANCAHAASLLEHPADELYKDVAFSIAEFWNPPKVLCQQVLNCITKIDQVALEGVDDVRKMSKFVTFGISLSEIRWSDFEDQSCMCSPL